MEALESNYKIQEKYHQADQEAWIEYEQLDFQKVRLESYEKYRSHFIDDIHLVTLSSLVALGISSIKSFGDINLPFLLSCYLGIDSGFVFFRNQPFLSFKKIENLGDLSEFDMKLYDNQERRKGVISGYDVLLRNADNLSESIAKIDSQSHGYQKTL